MKHLHIAIRVSDPQKSIEFYQQLGFAKIKEVHLDKMRTTLIFLENSATIELVHNWDNKNKPSHQDGFLHIGIQVENLENFLQKLSPSGIKPINPVFTTPEGMKICFIKDPDGYQIELTEPVKK